MTKDKVALLMNHINSTKREGLGNQSPLEVAKGYIDKEIIKKLGIERIPPDDVLLTAKLLK